MANNNSEFQRRLWEATDQLRASEYSVPVLGMFFLKYADSRFEAANALRRIGVPEVLAAVEAWKQRNAEVQSDM